MRLALTLACLLWPAPARAERLDARSVGRGAVFKRQNGAQGIAIRKGGAIGIDDVTNRVDVQDERIARFGIYETEWRDYPYGPDMVGVGTVVTETAFSRMGPEPEPGKGFDTGWRKTVSDYAPVGSSPVVTRAGGSTGDRLLAVREVRLSGRTCRGMAGEAAVTSGGPGFTLRSADFRAPGLGLGTRRGARKLGLVEKRAPA